jgi:hypothetical protein
MPLAIYVLLGLCIALSVCLILDELLEQREESRLKPRLQKHRHPATPADASGAAASVKAKGMTPEKQQESPQRPTRGGESSSLGREHVNTRGKEAG